jgi:ActR/RegA family two-component response regulator
LRKNHNPKKFLCPIFDGDSSADEGQRRKTFPFLRPRASKPGTSNSPTNFLRTSQARKTESDRASLPDRLLRQNPGGQPTPENPFICCIYPRRLRPRPIFICRSRRIETSESGVSSVTRWIEVRMGKQPRILFADTRKVFELRYRRSSSRMVLSSPPAVAFPKRSSLISEQRFEVLIADLNIGSPGDGFTIVSAMRRTQPEAVTLILTGYAAFETALEAIRRQVDEYLTKPTDIDLLVTTIRSSRRPDQAGSFDPDATPAGYLRRQPELDHRALAGCGQERCRDQPLSDRERTDHIPRLLAESLAKVRTNESRAEAVRAARLHGTTRQEQGDTLPLIIRDAGCSKRSSRMCRGKPAGDRIERFDSGYDSTLGEHPEPPQNFGRGIP